MDRAMPSEGIDCGFDSHPEYLVSQRFESGRGYQEPPVTNRHGRTMET